MTKLFPLLLVFLLGCSHMPRERNMIIVATLGSSACSDIKLNGNKGIFHQGYMYGNCPTYTFTMKDTNLSCTIQSGETSCMTIKDVYVTLDKYPGTGILKNLEVWRQR